MRHFLLVLALTVVCLYHPAIRAGDEAAPEGFESLFNAKDLTGWQVNQGGNIKVWGAENGILYVNGAGGGWLMTDKEYGDFELRLEFKIPPKGNSGVALRSPLVGDAAYAAGVQAPREGQQRCSPAQRADGQPRP